MDALLWLVVMVSQVTLVALADAVVQHLDLLRKDLEWVTGSGRVSMALHYKAKVFSYLL